MYDNQALKVVRRLRPAHRPAHRSSHRPAHQPAHRLPQQVRQHLLKQPPIHQVPILSVKL